MPDGSNNQPKVDKVEWFVQREANISHNSPMFMCWVAKSSKVDEIVWFTAKYVDQLTERPFAALFWQSATAETISSSPYHMAKSISYQIGLHNTCVV